MTRAKKVTPIRRLDVTVSELREIAAAMDDCIQDLYDIGKDEPEAIVSAQRMRATRNRIAPPAEFPITRQPGARNPEPGGES